MELDGVHIVTTIMDSPLDWGGRSVMMAGRSDLLWWCVVLYGGLVMRSDI